MKPINGGCSGEWSYTMDGNEFDCQAVHEQSCEHCVACLPHMLMNCVKEKLPISKKELVKSFVNTTWYDPENGRRIGKKAIKKLVAQIRANL